MVYNAKINVTKIKAAEKCLIDNGIDKEVEDNLNNVDNWEFESV